MVIVPAKAWYQAFFWVLIDLIIGFLGLIIKAFDNQTEICPWLSIPLIIKLFEMLDDHHDYFVYKTFTHKARSKIYSFGQATWQTLCRSEPFFLQWKQECCMCETTPCCHLLQLPAAPLQLLNYYHSTSEFFVITMVAYSCRCVMGSQVSRRPSFRILPNELCKE